MAKKKKFGGSRKSGAKRFLKKAGGAVATGIQMGYITVPLVEGVLDLAGGKKSFNAVGIETIYDLSGYDVTKKVFDSRHLGERAMLGGTMFLVGWGIKKALKRV